ncbi:ankyrin repeat domain-containing protein [Vibrio sp. TMPB1044]|uniref:ankyrin repeat domain-containing protein n=1 Tax=Vibrio sp. TMPB1044 TaxID=3051822 RepID=UPI00255B71D0|nr:ankyrin repeat domain-containing protein [Vibrio sp. TMPB1044]MDL5028145.1 ankyrin repeat domain-containing protein [Vibrio sp. TMPB1044]MDN5208273.1 ankyrin repeat domain-containing protein [Vibrio sp. TMPB1044]
MRRTFSLIGWVASLGLSSTALASVQPPVCQALSQELNTIYSSSQSDSYSLRLASEVNLNDENQLTVKPPFTNDNFSWTNWTLDSAKLSSPKSLNFRSGDTSKNEDLQLHISGFEWWRGLTYQYQTNDNITLQGNFHNAGPFGWFYRSFWNVFYFQEQPYVMATSGLYKPITVYSIKNGNGQAVCNVEPPISVDVRKDNLDLAYRHALQYFMTDIEGNFGSMGSRYYSYTHDLMLDVIYRPSVHTENADSDKEVDSLAYLAQSDAWSARELGSAKNIASINRSYLKGYFTETSNQLDANNLASLILDQVYADYDRRQLDENGRAQLKQLTEALSDNDTESILKSCQENINSESFDYYHDNQRNMTDCLSLVLDKSMVLEDLVAQCAEPNSKCALSEANAFGKNLLMYAAHMNNPKAVSVMLNNSEMINTTTINTARFDFPLAENLTTYGRTPLMYAAENASQRTIQLLLDAGADPKLKDSKGNDYFSYMDKNWRFNSSKARAYLSKPGPSFNCELASSTREKAICSDTMLSDYDRELSYLYGEAYDQSPNAQALKTDQRKWLKDIDQSCSSESSLVECLSHEYRERIRAFEFIAFSSQP